MPIPLRPVPIQIYALLSTLLLLGPVAWLPAQEPAAAPAAHDRLVVLNKAAGTASLFDPSTRKEVARVEVGTGPHEVAVAPDGRTAVVCNYGDQRPGNSLTIVDVPAARAIATFVLESTDGTGAEAKTRTWLRPHGIQFLADGRHVLVTSEQTRRLLVVDVRERKVVRTLPTPQPQLHMVALAPDGKRAFGASLRDGTMAVFELSPPDGDPAPAVTIATGEGAEGIAARPGSREVWVANRAVDKVSIVDPDGRKVLAELATGAMPIRVAFTPDGARALVSCAEGGVVQVFDATARKLAATVDLLAERTELSPQPIGICMAPDGRTAWVACARGEFLAVLDLQQGVLIDRVPAGPGPDGMAWARWTDAAAK